MQYMPGFTVQCINPLCDARGHWLRADGPATLGTEGHCPCCGDFLRNVPPPLGPRFRMRPRSLTARPPLPPRPRELNDKFKIVPTPLPVLLCALGLHVCNAS